MESTIYIIGLIIAVGFVIFSIDDIFFDFVYLFRGRKKIAGEKVPIDQLEDIPPKLLALMVAAWHEDNVLESVIDHMIATIQYPRSMYHIFLGVYPNDIATKEAASWLEEKYDNVHVIVNKQEGPTCKADNLNWMIKKIEEFENARNWRFASMTVHDSEDVIHPYELSITNYLIDQYDCLQFPVFPLQRKPSLKNLFAGMTTGTYADEFAENHFRGLVVREKMNGFVPSAGTGFVMARRTLDSFGDAPVFPEDTLTEDYKLSFIMEKHGLHTHYVLEKIPRLLDNGKVKWDYVATRSIFPAKFGAAVRQKTRWIYGITMQSTKFWEIFKTKNISFATRYTIYKDLKAKIGNILILPGYAVFIYFMVSLFFQLPIIYPEYTFSWYLCVFLTVAMLFRQVLRAIAIYHVYGMRSVIVSCFLPPLMPIRLVWGNIINMCATLRAWKQLVFGIKNRKAGKKEVWVKTEHEFLSDSILYRYYRHIGDVLMAKGSIDENTLDTMLKLAKEEKIRIGQVLLREGIVNEEQLMIAVANVQHTVFIPRLSCFNLNPAKAFSKIWLVENAVFPVLSIKGGFVFAITNDTPQKAITELEQSGMLIHTVYTTKKEIAAAVENIDNLPTVLDMRIGDMVAQGQLNWEQGVLALANRDYEKDILLAMGLITERDKSGTIMEEAIS